MKILRKIFFSVLFLSSTSLMFSQTAEDYLGGYSTPRSLYYTTSTLYGVEEEDEWQNECLEEYIERNNMDFYDRGLVGELVEVETPFGTAIVMRTPSGGDPIFGEALGAILSSGAPSGGDPIMGDDLGAPVGSGVFGAILMGLGYVFLKRRNRKDKE